MAEVLLPPPPPLEAATAGADDRKGELTKLTDAGSTAAEYWLAWKPVEAATAATTVWKTDDCGESSRRLDCIVVVESSVGALPRLTDTSKRTPALPGPAASRRWLTTVVWPVATSVTFLMAICDGSTPSSEAKPVATAARTRCEPTTSLGLRVLEVGETAKLNASSTSGTLVGEGLWLGVAESDAVVEPEGVRVSEGVLVSEGEAVSEAVLVVETVGVMLIVAVSEGVVEAAAVGVEEGGRMHVPEGPSQ